MSIVNDLHYADGRQVKNVTGGGLFMLGGVLSYTADVGFQVLNELVEVSV